MWPCYADCRPIWINWENVLVQNWNHATMSCECPTQVTRIYSSCAFIHLLLYLNSGSWRIVCLLYCHLLFNRNFWKFTGSKSSSVMIRHFSKCFTYTFPLLLSTSIHSFVVHFVSNSELLVSILSLLELIGKKWDQWAIYAGLG